MILKRTPLLDKWVYVFSMDHNWANGIIPYSWCCTEDLLRRHVWQVPTATRVDVLNTSVPWVKRDFGPKHGRTLSVATRSNKWRYKRWSLQQVWKEFDAKFHSIITSSCTTEKRIYIPACLNPLHLIIPSTVLAFQSTVAIRLSRVRRVNGMLGYPWRSQV
jgi:hypothetical protein